MQFTIIEQEPKESNMFAEAPYEDEPEKFVLNLAGLLKNGAYNIKTKAVPIGWVTEAVKRSETKRFKISMMRVPVNSGEAGTAFGRFFFELLPVNNG